MKRKILSMALCLSMLISLVAFAPASFAVDSSEPFTMSEQNNQASTQTDAGNVPAPEQTTPAPDAGNTESSVAPDANAPAETQPDANGAPADGTVPNAAPDAQAEMPKTVPFTDAGPFMPAVNVAVSAVVKDAAMQARMAASRVLMAAPKAALAAVTPEPENGLILNKTATKNYDGTYKITLDAYTTGTVTSSSKMVPVDIVLVLDQSGSMRFDMNGNDNVPYDRSRQKAMKAAVDNFIQGVASKYTDEADHRMSIVTFGSQSNLLSGWKFVDSQGSQSLRNSVSGLPSAPSGATNVAAGMERAVTQMGSNYNYTGKNTERQKVVITFTDGVPTTNSDFDTTVATNAIEQAKTLKDQGCTSYSIGIFTGANPNQLHGDKWSYAYDRYDDIPCTGEVGSYWGGSWANGIINSNDFALIDIAAGNRFLNYLSNNFKSASQIGVERDKYNPGDHLFSAGTGYKIIKNFNRDDSKYYLTASNSEELNSIFQNIVQNIVTPQIDLGSKTVIRDIISESFELPSGADASSIKLYTADATSTTATDGIFAERKPVAATSGITAKVNGDTVDVTGFDYNKNFVTENAKPEEKDAPYGKKLIIEFDVKVKDGFLGGNGVPTNGTASGVYGSDGKLVEGFPVPKVDLPIADISVKASDKNVYLLGSLAETNFDDVKTVTINGKEYTKEQFDALGWENNYLDLKFDNIVITGGDFDNLTADKSYNINATLSSKERSQEGAKTASATGKINVFKPSVTYKDLRAYYGATAPAETELLKSALVSTVWKHNQTSADDVTMIGDAPTIDRTAVLATLDHVKNGVYATADDSYYKVTSKIGTVDISSYVTNAHQPCDANCKFEFKNGQFIVHKDTCTLDITKIVKGGGTGPFIMKVTGDTKVGFEPFEVLVEGGKTVNIKGLPIGTYTVTEDTDWAWKYTVTGDNAKTELTETNPSGKVTITNTLNGDKWLNFVTSIQNLFTGKKAN